MFKSIDISGGPGKQADRMRWEAELHHEIAIRRGELQLGETPGSGGVYILLNSLSDAHEASRWLARHFPHLRWVGSSTPVREHGTPDLQGVTAFWLTRLSQVVYRERSSHTDLRRAVNKNAFCTMWWNSAQPAGPTGIELQRLHDVIAEGKRGAVTHFKQSAACGEILTWLQHAFPTLRWFEGQPPLGYIPEASTVCIGVAPATTRPNERIWCYHTDPMPGAEPEYRDRYDIFTWDADMAAAAATAPQPSITQHPTTSPRISEILKDVNAKDLVESVNCRFSAEQRVTNLQVTHRVHEDYLEVYMARLSTGQAATMRFPMKRLLDSDTPYAMVAQELICRWRLVCAGDQPQQPQQPPQPPREKKPVSPCRHTKMRRMVTPPHLYCCLEPSCQAKFAMVAQRAPGSDPNYADPPIITRGPDSLSDLPSWLLEGAVADWGSDRFFATATTSEGKLSLHILRPADGRLVTYRWGKPSMDTQGGFRAALLKGLSERSAVDGHAEYAKKARRLARLYGSEAFVQERLNTLRGLLLSRGIQAQTADELCRGLVPRWAYGRAGRGLGTAASNIEWIISRLRKGALFSEVRKCLSN